MLSVLRMEVPTAGNRRRSAPLFRTRRAHGEEDEPDKRGPLVIDPKRERVRWGSGEHRQRAMGEAVACWACWAARRGPWQAGFSLTGRVALGLVLAREVRG